MNNDMENDSLLMKIEILKHNLQKISLINKIFTILIVVLFLNMNILSNISFFNFNSSNSLRLIHYLTFLIFNIFIFYLLDIRKIHVTKENIKKVDIFVSAYVILFISIGACISFANYDIYNPLLIYTLTLFVCSSFLVLKTMQVTVPISISSSILLIGLYLQNGIDSNFKLQLIYLLSLAPITYFISRSFYYSFERSIKFQLELMKEARLSRNLTKKLREANRKLELQVSLDPLTNLYNRRGYNEYLKDLQLRVKEKPYNLSVIMVDVDCFKLYNDTYGHTQGDSVLVKIGQLLYDIADEFSCFSSRWGGEEFVLLLVNQTVETTENICSKIRKKVNKLKIDHCSSHINEFVTVSIGACTMEITNPGHITDCINEADDALYYVKHNGRNSYEHRYGVHVV
ncbi:GGDEF domain-containing protein [Lysinibacillus telephonicus]|uniref:GGDEF domain-containing protein n=1 Tax=Lysinibacillus telephonicus TaxID=1714840 RepID=UPI0031FBCCA1